MEDLCKLAECPVCSKFQTDYRTLHCGHSICETDLVALGKNASPKCPLCGTLFRADVPISSFPKDVHKIALAELALQCEETSFSQKEKCSACGEEGTLWCQEDECAFCETHAQEAHKYGKARNHTLVDPSKKVLKVNCTHHKKELDKYCMTCNKIICMGKHSVNSIDFVDCFVLQHVGHKIENVASVFEERRNSLLSEWTKHETHLMNKFTEEQTRIQKTEAMVSQNLLVTRQTITNTFEKAINVLQERQQELLKQVQQREKDFNLKVVLHTNQIKDALAEIRMQTEVLKLTAGFNATKFMEMENIVQKNIERWNQPYQPVPVELLEISFQEFTSRILETQLQPRTGKFQACLMPSGESTKLKDHPPYYGRGYLVMPSEDVTLSDVQVRFQSNPDCFVVITNENGDQIQKSSLKHICGDWYRAQFNIVLLANSTYHIMCIRPKGEPVYYRDDKYQQFRYIHPFHIKSKHTEALETPFKPLCNSYSIEMTLGYN